MTERDSEWENEKVEVSKPVGTVISVRVPPDVAQRIFDQAERRGVPVSAILREAVDAYLEGTGVGTPATMDITVSSMGTVTLLAGHSPHGRTVGAPTAFEGSRDYQLVLGS
jgi:hypothetical protein